MSKPLFGKLTFETTSGGLADATTSGAEMSGPKSGPRQTSSSIDPLATTDRYRLVVPFSADPRRLVGKRATGRGEGALPEAVHSDAAVNDGMSAG
jgi:hypothetical protein